MTAKHQQFNFLPNDPQKKKATLRDITTKDTGWFQSDFKARIAALGSQDNHATT
ncbi:hypothetical protein [Lactococcus allomyrinae]|uniref:hypothetical protein n=1 Tax=Lactococcus allomyrinae TaxID=2419773 RepID=UPI0013C456DA|nr:hypothetical protein [Lactococcus allomyrinae]